MTEPSGLLNTLLIIGVILGGIGYAVGQFASQRRKGQSDALQVALSEIDALRVRAERQQDELTKLREDVARLHAENVTLREVLSGGTFLAEQIRTLIAEEVEKGAHAVVNLLEARGNA